jgi:MarR family transcriptional regulator for hemolysin
MVKCEPVTINDMARHFGFKPPSLVPVVDALEKQGLIERKPDESDHRKTLLVIRQKGANLLKKIPRGGKNHALDIAFEKLSGQNQKDLLKLLEELLNNFPEQ